MKKEKILIVEDDKSILTGLLDLLSGEGYEVCTATDGNEALRIYKSDKPTLILLDIMIPEKSGYDVCKEIRKKDSTVPILMLTAKGQEIDKVVGLEVGADDYVTKPFNSRELLARIHAQLRSINRRGEKIVSPGDIESDKESRSHLLAVMFTDMKDYSKKMHKNEQWALSILQIHNEMMKEAINSYGGRIIEIIGDAFVVSFESAVASGEATMVSAEIVEALKYVEGEDPYKDTPYSGFVPDMILRELGIAFVDDTIPGAVAIVGKAREPEKLKIVR